jgi:hypothetical protein
MNKCGIVKDLLPLYADDVCSIESKKLVAEHLAECEECQKELESYQLDVITDNAMEKEAVKKFRKKTERKITLKVVSIVLAVCIGVIGAFNVYWYSAFIRPFAKYEKTEKEYTLECRENNTTPIEAILGKDNSYGIDTDKYETLGIGATKYHNYYANGGFVEIFINRPEDNDEVLYSDKEALKNVGISITVSRNNNLRYEYLVMFDFLVDENDNNIYFYIDEDMNLILNTEENYGVNFYHTLGSLTEKELQEKHNGIRQKIYEEVYEDLRVMMIVLHEGFGIGNVKA